MRPLLIQVREVGGGGRNGSFPRSLTKLSGKCPLLEGCGQVREEAPAERLCRCCQAVAGSEPMFSCSWLKRLKIERHVLLKRKGFIQAVRVSGSWRPSFPRLILKRKRVLMGASGSPWLAGRPAGGVKEAVCFKTASRMECPFLLFPGVSRRNSRTPEKSG